MVECNFWRFKSLVTKLEALKMSNRAGGYIMKVP